MDPVNRRKYFRAEITVPVRWRALMDEEIKLVEKGTGSALFKSTDLPGPIDELMEEAVPGSKEEQLYRCLQLINNKLDFIIDQTLLKSTENPSDLDDVIEISGSGLKFTSRKYVKPGTLLKMSLIMPEALQYQMEFIAEVVRAEEKGNSFINAVKILVVKEDTRESIVQVVFQRQRKEIRMERIDQEDNGLG
ncbi:MAG: PilZ domain-containing protein [Deltaproteobacteria bacterium]|nr:PilZ domain-containing protein [Deltaproteobacteria bacterium]